MLFHKRLLLSAWMILQLHVGENYLYADSARQLNSVPSRKSRYSLRIRIQDEPETLDWNKAHTWVESYLLTNLMEGLVTYDARLKIAPALAESWSTSADGKTYIFKLRPGVKWSDGVPLRAQDFVYSWKRLLSPVIAAPYAYLLFDIEGAEAFSKGELQDFNQVGIKAIDDHTFTVHLKRAPNNWIFIPAFWATFPLRQDVVDKFGSSWDSPGRMVNLGPFSIVTHDLGSKFILKTNPLYYGKRGNLDEVIAHIVKDDAEAISLYESGKLDIVSDLSWVNRNQLKSRSDIKVFQQLKTAFLGFVVDQFPVSNVKLRRAIAKAIDKHKLSLLLKGGQQPATSFIPPGLSGYSKKLGLTFNPSQAKKVLRESGLLSDGTLTVGYALPNWDKSLIVARFIQDELQKNLRVHVNLVPLDNKAYRSQLELRNFSVFDYSWTADYPDPDNFLSFFMSFSGNNRTNWKNKKFDSWIQAAKESRNPRERETLYNQSQKLLLEDEAVIIPLYYEPILALVSSRIKGPNFNSMNYLYLRGVRLISQ